MYKIIAKPERPKGHSVKSRVGQIEGGHPETPPSPTRTDTLMQLKADNSHRRHPSVAGLVAEFSENNSST